MEDRLALSDAALVQQALKGDKLALFVLKARHTAQIAVAIDPDAWDLTELARAECDNPSVIDRRAGALEAARLFFTEALHQETDAPIGLHFIKKEAWQL